jgi:hypothetical protein
MNAKCGLDLYRMVLPKSIQSVSTMILGVDVINMGRTSIIGMTATYNQHMMQYCSETVEQNLYKEMIGKGFSMKDQ